MFLEIELKLSIDANPVHIALLFNHSLLSGATPEVETLTSRYFDTPDLCLWKNGLALRTRQAGSRTIQTLKTAGEQRGDLMHREEWDQPVEKTEPDISAFEDEAVAKKLATLVGKQSLVEVFHTRIKRTQWIVVAADGTIIELVLDQGSIHTATNKIPLHEIELELKQGDVNQIEVIADLLKKTIPLTLETRSKAERGYKLYFDSIERLPNN